MIDKNDVSTKERQQEYYDGERDWDGFDTTPTGWVDISEFSEYREFIRDCEDDNIIKLKNNNTDKRKPFNPSTDSIVLTGGVENRSS